MREDDEGAPEAHDASAPAASSEADPDGARLHDLPSADEETERRARRAARPRRTFGLVPIAYREDFDPDDIIEALIETIDEELTVDERIACSELPIGQDPVYWLIRRYATDPLTLGEIGALWGVSRERVRQIEAKALARKTLTVGMRDAYEALISDGGDS